MDLQNPDYLAQGIPTIMPMFNNEEKLDELQRLLDILAKRKKYSIIVSMLVVFQKYNFQKLLKDFLTDGVREIIIQNPLKVVSYHGVPFSVNNFFRGMRVEYSKHKLFQREIIEGNEYVFVNLVYTCIFLSDEIAKICKGSRNLKLKTIHASLIDEIDVKGNNQNNNVDNYNTSSKFINEMKNLDDGDNKLQENIQKEINNDNMGKRLTRRQKNNFMNGGIINLDESDEDNEEEKQIDSNNSKKGEKTNKVEKQTDLNKVDNNNENTKELNKDNNNINSTGINKEKENTNIKGVNKYQDDLIHMKSTLGDILNIFDYSSFSPLNNYLRDNGDNIISLHDSFNSIQSIGKTGEIYINELINLIPENLIDEINITKNNNYELCQNKTKELDKLYIEYEKIKNKLLFYYTSIQSTVKNIRHSGDNFEENLIKNDLEFIDLTEKKYLKNVDELFPLMNKIYNFFCNEFPLKSLIEKLQQNSNELNKNELNVRVINNFLQGIWGLFPNESGNDHTCFDLIVNKNIDYEEREKMFKKKLIDEMNLLTKYIEPLRKYFKEKKEKSN